jgi:hypothetical protein
MPIEIAGQNLGGAFRAAEVVHQSSRAGAHFESYEADMDIDLNTPNAERIALPAIVAAPHRNRNRRQRPLSICHSSKPIGSADRASTAFAPVPEARQTYPAEDASPPRTRVISD